MESTCEKQSVYFRKNLFIYPICVGCCRFISHNHLFCSIRRFSIILSHTTLLYYFIAINKGVDKLFENSTLF